MAITATRIHQADASDPQACVWVSANAGTGKTTVLVRRFVRALLAGTPPDAILCLTFTKAAAMEMSNRLLKQLAAWPAMDEDELRRQLRKELDREGPGCDVEAHELETARALFARVLDTPGGLKIMTIHSFCDRVLRRFPLEAGVAPGFTLFSDDDAGIARDQAAAAALELATGGEDDELEQALAAVIAYAGEESFQGLSRELLARKEPLPEGGDLAPVLREAFGVGEGDTPETLADAQCRVCSDALLGSAWVLMESEKVTDQNLGGLLAEARRPQGAQRRAAFAKAFLTAEGKPRADTRFITKAVQTAYPALTDGLRAARDEFARLEAQRQAAETVTASAALFKLAAVTAKHYERIKAERNALDYQDLIQRASALLGERGSPWVLYRLDASIRHVLVDEAQDTNPEQWTIVSRLTQEFFTGEGAVEEVRTVFAVGDEKQSIFGFQGADPAQFAIAGERFKASAGLSGVEWRDVPLTLSFRTVAPVLRAVDEVLRAMPEFAEAAPPPHASNRADDAGLVEIWPTEKMTAAEKGDAWRPLDDASAEAAPAVRLAARIAGTIREWLDNGEILASQGRPVEPGDILILLRKRAPFASLITRALRQRGVPVAGADRLTLSDSIAVLDLLALGDFLLQPLDDLALASVLKSPLFDWSDDDLFALGHGREGSLWQALRESRHVDITATLERWRGEAVHMPPFEFYAARLEVDGLRGRFIAALGAEAGDAIDELLNLALSFGETPAPSLQAFLHHMRNSSAEIKRDLDAAHGEVRVMTVHGAKGLEAGIVFLADTCSAKSRGGSSIVELAAACPELGLTSLPVWAIPAARKLPPVVEARKAVRGKEEAEYRRLLYVAMTRARDRLYVTGFEGSKGRDAGCWYDLIHGGLTAIEGAAKRPDGVTCLESRQVAPMQAKNGVLPPYSHASIPAWASTPASLDAPRRQKLRPSTAGDSAAAHSGSGPTSGHAALRGEFIHRLLELLPGTPRAAWDAAARHLLHREAAALPGAIVEDAIARAAAILEDSRFGELFGPDSRAEVPIQAWLGMPGGLPFEMNGRIDRLVVNDHSVVIVDFKTGAVPHNPADTPRLYLIQLAAYRTALRKIFRGKTLRAAILWTEAPLLVEIPAADLDAAEIQLAETAVSPGPPPLDEGR